MFPPIFSTCAAVGAVTVLFGTSPVRFWPFSSAPQDASMPYAVWQIIGGSPENYLGQVPDIDRFSLQVDVYATTGSAAQSAAAALRDAIEPHAHITAWRGGDRDAVTKTFRVSFDVEWIIERS